MFSLCSSRPSGCISPKHAHYIYDDMWPFPLVNVKHRPQREDRQNRIAHCAPVRNWEKGEERARIVFLSLALGFRTSQSMHLLEQRENTHTSTHTHTWRHTPAPFPHILRGEVRLSAVCGAGGLFLLAGTLPMHMSGFFLQTQAAALTVTYDPPAPDAVCLPRSPWKTDLWREHRLI